VGYYGGFGGHQLFFDGDLNLKLYACHDPDNYWSDVLPLLRGYDQPLPGTTGGAFTLEYVRPLIPLRTGSWPLCLYLEDLYTALFVDAAVPSKGNTTSPMGWNSIKN
jgi:hypothetical protein